jgi:hypothetical protein
MCDREDDPSEALLCKQLALLGRHLANIGAAPRLLHTPKYAKAAQWIG